MSKHKAPDSIQNHYTESDFNRLLESPNTYSFSEFEAITNQFRLRLTLDDHYQLIVKRLRFGQYQNQTEKNALLACIEGRCDEADRLRDLLKRRNALSLKVI